MSARTFLTIQSKLGHAHLVVWGAHDLSFDLRELERYRKDVPKAEVHVLDAGYFALDTAADEFAELIRNFVGSSRSEFEERRVG